MSKRYASDRALEAMDTEQAVDYIQAGHADTHRPTAHIDRVMAYLDDLGVTDELRFGPGFVTDLCRCGHDRGSHWDGEGACDPATCGCRIFRDGGEW